MPTLLLVCGILPRTLLLVPLQINVEDKHCVLIVYNESLLLRGIHIKIFVQLHVHVGTALFRLFGDSQILHIKSLLVLYFN